jgi:NADP-dependent 3-hydroxy acid dehydrogenase YdfG
VSGLLAGRVGLITGGGDGIGAATARLLVQQGAQVVAMSRRAISPAKDSGHKNLLTCRGDVRNLADLEHCVEAAIDAFGHIDFAVANAGVGDQSSIVSGDPAWWRVVLETNVLGVAHTVRAVLPHLRRAGRGDIVIIGSIASRETYVGEPAYVASKWAVAGLGRALRREARHYGVRTTLLQPGLTETPLSHSTPIIESWLQAVDPLQPDDIARAIAFVLAQPDHVAINEIVLRPQKQEV